MDFDNSWKALLDPGDTETGYFHAAEAVEISPEASEYQPANAWFLAEMSRLVYNRDAECRRTELARFHLDETPFQSRRTATNGLVAVTRPDAPRRFAIVAFRGTDHPEDWWLTNLDVKRVDWRGPGRVHGGFREALASVWEQVEDGLRDVPEDWPLVLTGHSLGGALAILTLALLGRRVTSTYVYGVPRIGNCDFATAMAEHDVFHIVNNTDLAARVPPQRLGFEHVGRLFYINHRGELLRDPDPSVVSDDRRRSLEPGSPENERRFYDPPEDLADHTPQNYVAHLTRLLPTNEST